MATAVKEQAQGAAQGTVRNVGKIVQVIGPVLDIEFEPEHLPEIYNALEIANPEADPPIRMKSRRVLIGAGS